MSVDAEPKIGTYALAFHPVTDMDLRPVRAVSVEKIRVCVSKEGQRSVHPKSTWSPRCHSKVWTAYVNQRLEKPGFRGRSFGQLKAIINRFTHHVLTIEPKSYKAFLIQRPSSMGRNTIPGSSFQWSTTLWSGHQCIWPIPIFWCGQDGDQIFSIEDVEKRDTDGNQDGRILQ